MKPENAMNRFKGAGFYPLNRKAIEHCILTTEKKNNQEYTKIDSSTSIASSEVVTLNSPLNDLKKAILQTFSPTPSVNTVSATENSKKKRKRVQSKSGEVLTNKTVLERLVVEERDRKKKFSQANIEKETDNVKVDFKEIKQGSWVEVQYQTKSQSSKFIGQVIEINEFYHRKYLTKSPFGDY
ncbi:hypothetical protein AVEN_158910-1 [Araneus ventricosus]|uniref:Uncharacterized protein n=1 Tax=Araneus ventricosus TaxID=182803 RepID=A0A4Y2B983_ARAVE|nr:hypothetical protein AVEN_158910-1 [Araneus ventricosus]